VFFARGAGSILGIGIAVIIANRLGASAASDAFFLIRGLTLGLAQAARGLTVMVYVPPLVSMFRANRSDSVNRMLGWHVKAVFGPTLLLAFAIALLAPWVVILLAPGFDAERVHLASGLLRILIFIIPLQFLLSLLISLHYAFKRFTVPELAATLPRFLAILVLFFLVPPMGVTAIGWALLGGTVIAVVLLTPVVAIVKRPENVTTYCSPTGEQGNAELEAQTQKEPELRKRSLPVILLQIYNQACGWLDFAFASVVMAGAVSIIAYGLRLALVVPVLLTTSFFTVLFAQMSHDAVEGGTKTLIRDVVISLRVGSFLLVPFAAFLVVAADPIVDLVFRHGAFDESTASFTTTVIQLFSPAIVLAHVIHALAMGGYADQGVPHMRVVSWMTGIGAVTRIAALAALPIFFGIAGIPVAIVLSGIATAVTAYYLLVMHWGPILRQPDLLALGKILIATACAGFAMSGVVSAIHASSFLERTVVVVALAVVGGVVYLVVASILSVEEAIKLRSLVARKRSSLP